MTNNVLPLKLNKKSTYYVDFVEMDRFIKDVYGRDFSCLEDQEMMNDSVYKFIIDGNLSKFDQERLKRWLDGSNGDSNHGYGFFLQIILNDLLSKKLIELGTYIITVCW